MEFKEINPSQNKIVYQEKESSHFDNLVHEHCYNGACDVIGKDKFVRDLLFDLKSHDEKTFLHSLEVGNMAAFLINQLGNKLNEKEKRVLMSSALLHDYGKTSIDPKILNKREPLTPQELLEIEKHPAVSFHILKEWDMDVAKVSVAHHEHQDHTYPRKGFMDDVMEKRTPDKEVDKLSRILAIIDSFQAMLDPTRPSNIRNPKTIDEAVAELNKKFVLNEDKEIIFLLEEYYYEKLKNEKNKISKEQVH